MELFPAADQRTLIKRLIDNCDYYILVVCGRYGSIDQSEGIGATQMQHECRPLTKPVRCKIEKRVTIHTFKSLKVTHEKDEIY